MNTPINKTTLLANGLPQENADSITNKINDILLKLNPVEAWKTISGTVLLPTYPFELHLFIFSYLFPEWPAKLDSAPAYIPDLEFIKTTNIANSMAELGINSIKEFHHWTVTHFEEFWRHMLDKLHIQFAFPPQAICDLSRGLESIQWLPGAKLNIVNSCFTAAPEKTALIYLNKNNGVEKLSYGELNRLSNRIANSLLKFGLAPNDSIAIDMPMTMEAVAIYLGIIKMGGVVVSIADSFTADEVATRIRISKAKAIFTQDYLLRGTKKISLYEKILTETLPIAIVLSCTDQVTAPLRLIDINWQDFLGTDDQFTSHMCDPMQWSNILFSSGTTGDPKAIPWNHTTGIKSASDAYFHQNIQSDDILCWPTNLGWMMGPWVIFASLINQATLALYHDVPKDANFGKYIQDAKVTMLGVVPALVAAWRQSDCMRGLNWQSIRKFSSTGECSNALDMFYLMSLVNYKPIIEYCGGTETGGGYLTSSVIENNYPSVFTTPAMGMNFVIFDEDGNPSNNGEVALVPPSVGLSTELLNFDHHKVYYAGMPKSQNNSILRRHGDQVSRLASGNYCILGRVDDTMNLGGIKTSSAEIERVVSGIEGINETAAIAVNLQNPGPSSLIIYAATTTVLDKELIKEQMQKLINQHLNPLFKIHDIVFIKELPKTASNKVMRRILRKQYT